VNGAENRGAYLTGFGRVRQAAHTGRYDLIHAHYVFSGVMALAQRRLPVLLTHHGIEAQRGWTAPLLPVDQPAGDSHHRHFSPRAERTLAAGRGGVSVPIRNRAVRREPGALSAKAPRQGAG